MELGEGEEGFRVLCTLVRQLRRNEPLVCGEINAEFGVRHQDVMRVLDCFHAAGIEEIRFVGSPPPR
jgi:biopolymer transport protein ExbD